MEPSSAPRIQWAGATRGGAKGGRLTAEAAVEAAREAGHDTIALADRDFAGSLPTLLAKAPRQGLAPIAGLWLAADPGDSRPPRYGAPPGSLLAVARSWSGYAALGRMSEQAAGGPRTARIESEEVLLCAADTKALAALGSRVDAVAVCAPGETDLRRAADRARRPAFALAPWWDPAPLGAHEAECRSAFMRDSTLEAERGGSAGGGGLMAWEAIEQAWQAAPELLQNARELAWLCRTEWRPWTEAFTIPGSTPGEDQARLVEEARAALGHEFDGAVPDAYGARLEQELDAIGRTGYASVFLIVAGLCRALRAEHIRVGPGRGSACGSLVSRCLGITVPDPLEHGLEFTRFINPSRVSPPDFDLDVEPVHQRRAQEVLRKLWGEERAAPITEVVTLKETAAFRAAASMGGIGHRKAIALASVVAAQRKARPEAAPDLAECEPSDRRAAERAWARSLCLAGCSQAKSRHPAAIALLAEDNGGRIPLWRPDGPGGEAVFQTEHEALEALGALKVDLLALSTLTLIRLAAEAAGVDAAPLMAAPPRPSDERVWSLLRGGVLSGVFQMESPGMRGWARLLEADDFHTLRALIALHRTGPMESLPSYARRRRGEEESRPPHPCLEPVLSETYGLVVYQEQAMQAAMAMAGFSPERADALRHAIGKKRPEEMARLEPEFHEGAAARGVGRSVAREVWRLLSKQSGYAFNKAHATGYALISCATLWLRAYHPGPFFTALAEVSAGRPDAAARREEVRVEALRAGVRLDAPTLGERPPAVHTWEEEARRIRSPVWTLKGIGHRQAEALDSLMARHAPEGVATGQQWRAIAGAERAHRPTMEALLAGGALAHLGEVELPEAPGGGLFEGPEEAPPGRRPRAGRGSRERMHRGPDLEALRRQSEMPAAIEWRSLGKREAGAFIGLVLESGGRRMRIGDDTADVVLWSGGKEARRGEVQTPEPGQWVVARIRGTGHDPVREGRPWAGDPTAELTAWTPLEEAVEGWPALLVIRVGEEQREDERFSTALKRILDAYRPGTGRVRIELLDGAGRTCGVMRLPERYGLRGSLIDALRTTWPSMDVDRLGWRS